MPGFHAQTPRNFSLSLAVSNGNCTLSDVCSSSLPHCNADKAVKKTDWVFIHAGGQSQLYFWPIGWRCSLGGRVGGRLWAVLAGGSPCATMVRSTAVSLGLALWFSHIML